jgi:hypothetical protein
MASPLIEGYVYVGNILTIFTRSNAVARPYLATSRSSFKFRTSCSAAEMLSMLTFSTVFSALLSSTRGLRDVRPCR